MAILLPGLKGLHAAGNTEERGDLACTAGEERRGAGGGGVRCVVKGGKDKKRVAGDRRGAGRAGGCGGEQREGNVCAGYGMLLRSVVGGVLESVGSIAGGIESCGG